MSRDGQRHAVDKEETTVARRTDNVVVACGGSRSRHRLGRRPQKWRRARAPYRPGGRCARLGGGGPERAQHQPRAPPTRPQRAPRPTPPRRRLPPCPMRHRRARGERQRHPCRRRRRRRRHTATPDRRDGRQRRAYEHPRGDHRPAGATAAARPVVRPSPQEPRRASVPETAVVVRKRTRSAATPGPPPGIPAGARRHPHPLPRRCYPLRRCCSC